MDDPTLATPLLTALALALTEVTKRVGAPDRILPVVSMIIGVGCAFLVITDADLRTYFLTGIIAGLSASGLWSGTRAMAGR